jgi:hypothetical protein
VIIRKLVIVALVASGTMLGYAAGAHRGTAPAPMSAAESRSFATVKARIDGAIACGRWTAEDQARAHEQLASLRPAERLQLMTLLARAVNEGRTRLETQGPPLL